MNSDSLQAVIQVIDVLEGLGVRYHVGGSWASSIHGAPRQTRDLDLVIDLPSSLIPVLVSRLEGEFYLDEERIRYALQRRSSFNMIHLATGFKIDVFLHGPGEFDRLEFERSGPQRIGAGQEREVVVKSLKTPSCESSSGTATEERRPSASGRTSWGSSRSRGTGLTANICTGGPRISVSQIYWKGP